MKKILAIFICCLPFYADCQLYNNPFFNIEPDTSLAPRRELALGSSYDLGSNAFNAKFYHAILFKNYISEDDKSAVLPNLGPDNHFGLILHNDLFYSWRTKEHNTHLYMD